jgi:tetratricopeptide (TPR) repeat protein
MPAPLRSAAALVLAGVLASASQPAAAPAAKPPAPPAADSALHESQPAPLIVTPSPPPAAAGAPPATEDTAIVNARQRAKESFGRGLMLEEQKAYSAAIISYMNAARMDPQLTGPSLRMGFLFAARQQWDAAARAFREELRRDPGSRIATREYAVTLAELGDTTRAIRMLEELSRRAPQDATVWRALGFAYTKAGRYAQAEKALRGAVALNSRYALAWRDLGVVLALLDKPAEARTAYGRALAADPTDETATVNLANLESRLGKHTEALAHYRQAEKLDSTQALAYRGQIAELVLMDREVEAGDVWRRWLAVFPDDTQVREGTARHFVRIERSDAALAVAREGVRRAPRNGEAWWLLGEVQSMTGDPVGAHTSYLEAADRFRAPADSARVAASLDTLYATAPDSLRARFAAERVAHSKAARDSSSRGSR